MTAGIGVPGYVGYAPGQPRPDLVQILHGAPANSPPVRVESVPGARYAYSGGGYEIVQALIETVTGRAFEAAMPDLVLQPLGMSHTRLYNRCRPRSQAMQRAGLTAPADGYVFDRRASRRKRRAQTHGNQ